MLSQASQAMVGPARRLLSLECVQNLNTFCVIGCVILSWCHGRVKYFWTPKFAWTHCHDKKFYLTTSLPVALWRLLAGTVMVEGHGIESCHGTAERSQEKVMVLLSVGARRPSLYLFIKKTTMKLFLINNYSTCFSFLCQRRITNIDFQIFTHKFT